MKNLILASIAASALGLAACSGEAEPATNSVQATDSQAPVMNEKPAPKAAPVSFKVTGMTWGAGCPPKVKSAVAKCLGVSGDKIEVDYETKEVTVDMDAEAFDKDALAKALKGGQYGIAGM